MLDNLNIAIAKAGGIFAFCRALGLTHQAVYQWKRRGWTPLPRAAQIEALYGVPASSLVEPSVRAALDSISARATL